MPNLLPETLLTPEIEAELEELEAVCAREAAADPAARQALLQALAKMKAYSIGCEPSSDSEKQPN